MTATGQGLVMTRRRLKAPRRMLVKLFLFFLFHFVVAEALVAALFHFLLQGEPLELPLILFLDL